ncbi:uncharacterized protein BDZ99DRAFT_497166 [Mytilinidion resinicola]|uniref:Uncharacterized protein n=1 Tax=Mytilinidion resinicola TaxID=574789 RepID=A0A6A6YTZ7_9PEZI|nr:uncharacterized protein BDZ99DRAFT_497166 [Mytilinidion resinicola]KAF2811387.1 hypothetical protein BDZ99DRAFT_497166 [Mytilinidion resinicola]
MVLILSQQEYRNGINKHHYSILARHRQSRSSDPRDGVFAFYGLACQQSLIEHGIVPDYGDANTTEKTVNDLTGNQTLRRQASILQDNQRQIYDWEDVFEAGSRRKYTTGEDMLKVMWQTCVACLYPEGKEKTRHMFHLFLRRQALLKVIRNMGLHQHIWIYMLVAIIGHVFHSLGIKNPEMDFRMAVGAMGCISAARTADGYVGMVPGITEIGDRVAILKGGKLPFILRERGSDWELIGDAYIHGIMKGEAWNESLCHPIGII